MPPLPSRLAGDSGYPGYTLIELLLVIAILGVLAALALPPLGRALDRTAVRGAAVEITALFGSARALATARGGGVAVRFDAARARMLVHAAAETLVVREFALQRQVSLEASRDSMAYDARGFGVGAANLRVILRRGTAAETVNVSRLGRVRR